MIVAADPEADLLLQLAFAGGAAVFDELRGELLRRLTVARRRGVMDWELIELATKTLRDFATPLAQLMGDARLAAWLLGGKTVADRVLTANPKGGAAVTPQPGPPPSFPPLLPIAGWEWDGDNAWLPIIEEAARDLERRRLMLPEEYRAAAADVRRQAFTAAVAQTAEATGKVRDVLVETVREGTGQRAFRKAVAEAVGESEVSPAYLENALRTNVQTAYSRGMDRVLDHPQVRDELPYEETLEIGDSRETDLCFVISRSGIGGTAIYRRDDPAYRHFIAPRHFGCRCGRRPLTIEQAAALGIKEAQQWLRTGIAPARPAFVPWPKVSLPQGWTPGGSVL